MDTPTQPTGRGLRALLATQFFNAFNDNAFKLIICLMAAKIMGDNSRFVPMAGAVFTLPFIVLSPVAGVVADRFSKRSVAVWAKIAEAVILVLGCVALWRHSPTGMLIVLGLMGVQSTFFSPVKYGLLPELLPDRDLSRGNGQLELWTFLAIIAGTAAAAPLLRFFEGGLTLPGGWTVGFRDQVHLTGVVLVGIAVAGVCTGLMIPPVPAASPVAGDAGGGFVRRTLAALREIRGIPALYLCVLGSAAFWLVGALFQMNVLLYADTMPGAGPLRGGTLLTITALGIGLGSVLAGRWSGEKVEFGLVPLGAGLLCLCSVAVSLTVTSVAWTTVGLFLLGTGAGLYLVPLNTYIQQKSPAHSRGRILATTNMLCFCAMLLAAAVLWLLNDRLGLTPAQVFLVTGVVLFGLLVYTVYLLPDFLVRFLGWALTHSVYRIRVRGRDNLPRTGGALLVCNHMSYADAVLLQVSTQRFIRFIMAREFYESKWFNPLCRLMKAIPISKDEGPKGLVASLRQAAEYLEKGELVCIFAEGTITRTGNLLPFNRGFEVIMRKADAPIIPVHLDGVWGSVFSFAGGQPFSRMPGPIPYPVTVSFGRPLPGASSAWEVRQAVCELAADAFGMRPGLDELLPFRFLRQARRAPRRLCMADSTGKTLTYGQAMVAMFAFARAIRRRVGQDPMVGVMLPAGVGGALCNLAIAALGRCPVNLNFTAAEESVNHAIAKCGIRTIFSSREFLAKANLPERSQMVFMEDFVKTVTGWDKAVAALIAWAVPVWVLNRVVRPHPKLPAPGLATVLFSSGSTGTPKGVMLSNANINANIEGLNQVVFLKPDDRMLGILPLFHSFGLTGTLWYPLCTGRGVVYHPNPLDFAAVGVLTAKYRTAILCTTPTFLLGYIRKCSPEQLSSLRYLVTGAEKLTPRLAEAFRDRFGVAPLEGYGCTELSPIVGLNLPDVQGAPGLQISKREGTIGLPIPGIAVRVVDPDTFATLPCGQSGLLLVKGPNVMRGYLDDPERTAEVVRDGWYVTGDIAVIDGDGFVAIQDRLSRFSKIGGEMIPHLLIEEKIHVAAGAVSERLCVVTAVPDEKKGERLVVLYKTDSLDVVKVHQALGAAGLPNLWVPKKESFFAVDALPFLGSGKPDLKRIRSLAHGFVSETPPQPGPTLAAGPAKT
ncbi:MAG: hypothetical protein A3K18_27140 [Lentisphaerae bacterium RIFOXYA12_64_32]|nr:MAG: hypothetical protein A3K18_27140 [Lentisphaerae bacterium RIFOXYA12_64_32]